MKNECTFCTNQATYGVEQAKTDYPTTLYLCAIDTAIYLPNDPDAKIWKLQEKVNCNIKSIIL